jgi:hypothetical protein
MEEPIIRRDQGAPAIALLSMEEPIDHRDVEDPGTETTVIGVDLKDSQDRDDVGTQMTSMRTRPIDHRDPDGPETGATAEMIDQEDQPLRRLHLLHLPDQHGMDDPDVDLLPSPTATSSAT